MKPTSIKWTIKSQDDIARLRKFQLNLTKNPRNATNLIKKLVKTARRELLDNPRIGEPLPQFLPREVRRLVIGDYEIRYEIVKKDIRVTNLFHTKEDR